MDLAKFRLSLDLDLTSDNEGSRCVCILDHLSCFNEDDLGDRSYIVSANSLKLIQCKIIGHTVDSINHLDLKMSD